MLNQLTYTSDHFDLIMKICTEQIEKGVFYCDNTPVDQMRKERGEGIESECRSNTPEKNKEIWLKMIEGDKAYAEYCVRAKIGMQLKNKCMRDPVMYRMNDTPHHRTGTKYKVYPTYDFACPIVDSIEGVTHTLRTNEYADRNEQFHWVQKALGLRKVTIYDFSRLNLVNTCLSKRKLQWFVDTGRVESWQDPRFPTLRGILRRGIRVETLIEFMLEQGPSKNTNLMEWDKLWSINKKIIDPIAPRYTAISSTQTAHLTLENGPENCSFSVAAHPQNPKLGDKIQFRSGKIIIEGEDASPLVVGEKVTLMKWGNCTLTKIENVEGSLKLTATLDESDKDFKSTKKLTWLSEDCDLVKVHLVEYDHLIKVKKVEEGMDFMDCLTDKSKFVTEAIAEPFVKNVQLGDIVQFERRGFFILDSRSGGGDKEQILEFVYIPDGKTKTMSTLSSKVDVKANIKGQNLATGSQGNQEETKASK